MAKIQHKRSSVVEGGAAKQPTAAQTEYGELCVNYSTEDPSLFIKDYDGNIIKIGTDINNLVDLEYFEENSNKVYIGQTPPADPKDGELWWNSSDDSGRLYVYYKDANSSQWVEASPQADALTEGDADGLYLSKVTNDTAAGEITFEGMTFHENGFNSGGMQSNMQSDTFVCTSEAASFRGASTEPDAYALNVALFSKADTTNAVALRIGQGTGNGFARPSYKGIDIQDIKTNDADRTRYGVYSALTSSVEGENYNFYTSGTAQNFLKGNTYIGGTTARNTFDLWKSTLTEEQLEELTAGTLVAPANVSLPGDGSFARQWWYDQQSAEDQALIDSGELDYPTHLAAATFTDTFDLGDNTAINLLSNGRGEFSGGVRVTGGSSAVDHGMSKSGGSLRINNEGVSAILINDTSNNLGFFGGTSAGTKVGGGNKEKRKGLLFTVGTKDATEDGSRPDQGFMAIQGQTILEPGKAVENISCFSASVNTNVGEALVKNQYGYYASSALRTAFNNYGFYTDLGESNHQGGAAYNFYAAGDAPNYFAGITEHKGGVKVTGGTASGISNGMFYHTADSTVNIVQNDSRALSVNDNAVIALNRFLSVNGTSQASGGAIYAFTGRTISPDGFDKNINGGSFSHTLNGGGTVNVPIHRCVDVRREYDGWTATDTVTDTYGVYISASLSPPDAKYNNLVNTYGVYTELTAQDGRNNYSFYAQGNAPNYFKGGVQFDTAAGTNALSNYEEGTYDLYLYAHNETSIDSNIKVIANYTVVGNVCTIMAALTDKTANHTGNMRFNLPFSPLNAGAAMVNLRGQGVGDNVVLNAFLNPDNSHAALRVNGGSDASSGGGAINFPITSGQNYTLQLSISYLIA